MKHALNYIAGAAVIGVAVAAQALLFVDAVAPAKATGERRESREAQAARYLSAKIISVENSSTGNMRPLVVVTNTSDRTFQTTWWACAFYLNGSPVHTDTVFVQNVRPGETPHRTISKAYRFDRSDCRLTLIMD